MPLTDLVAVRVGLSAVRVGAPLCFTCRRTRRKESHPRLHSFTTKRYQRKAGETFTTMVLNDPNQGTTQSFLLLSDNILLNEGFIHLYELHLFQMYNITLQQVYHYLLSTDLTTLNVIHCWWKTELHEMTNGNVALAISYLLGAFSH